MAAAKKKMSGVDTTPVEEEIIKPFPVDQDKKVVNDTKIKYLHNFKSWKEYHEYKGAKG